MSDATTKPVFDRLALARAFGRAAHQYDEHAVLQQEVTARLAERLPLIRHAPTRILDAGCGTGTGLQYLRQAYPDVPILALDMARPMLDVARNKVDGSGWLEKIKSRLFLHSARHAFVCADMEHLPLQTSSVDMIWSSLALQWANNLEACLHEWHRVIRPGGLLMFSTFGPDTLKELRQTFAHVDGGAHVSHFADLHDIGDMLVHAGFQNPVMEMDMMKLTYADLRSLMRDLKVIGAHNALSARMRGLMGKSAWQKLEAGYERHRCEGRLPATYEVIYGHAWANDKTRLQDGRQVIQFKIEQRKSGLR